MSLDGVQEARSTSVSTDVYSVAFENCRTVFPLRLIRPVNRYKFDGKFQLQQVLNDLESNSIKISDIVADNPKRSFLKDAKCFNATYGCEYCEAPAIQIKNIKEIEKIKKKYEQQISDINAQIEVLISNEQTSSAATIASQKTIDSLKEMVEKLKKDEKKEISSSGSRNLCWPASTMNGELRSEEKIRHIVNLIESSEEKLPPHESKGITGRSLLLGLNDFDLVENVSAEYLHLVCLGTVRRITELTFKVGENRQRVTKRKLCDPKEFNKKMRNIKVPKRFSRRCRNLDFSVLKAAEFRNIILFFFILVIECIGDDYNTEQNVWLDLAYAIRACVISEKEYSKIDKKVIIASCANFYKKYEKIYGPKNCTFSIHTVGSHLLNVRGDSPLPFRSAFLFENFYSEMKNLFCPGTSSPLKQILQNCIMKRQLETHKCRNKIVFKKPPKKETRENKSMVYTLSEDGHHNLYNITNVDNNIMTCVKQGKFPAQFNETIKRDWSKVGVYKVGPTCHHPVKINRKDIAGKIIKVSDYLITCPNHVILEK